MREQSPFSCIELLTGTVYRDKLFAIIEEKYKEVLRLNREDTEALREWGLALNDQAEQKEEEEADVFFAKARLCVTSLSHVFRRIAFFPLA